MASKLALGTAQFGLKYGIANGRGQVALDEVAAIVRFAWQKGIDTLDTAVAYGESETRLGRIGVTGWRVVSKLPGLPEDCRDVRSWVERNVMGSLERLGLESLHGLLLHRTDDLATSRGDELHSAMQRLKSSGVVRRVGLSVYDTEELAEYGKRFAFDLIQAPFNIFDRRIQVSGWLKRLKEQGVEVHARSAFLQGLLLMPSHHRPKFSRWQPLWTAWDRWLAESKLTPVAACLGFALRHPEIDRMVVGVDDAEQLRALLEAEASSPVDPPAELATNDRDLINPSRWSTL